MPNENLEQLMRRLNGKNKMVAKSFLTWKQWDEEDDTLTADDIEAIEQAV